MTKTESIHLATTLNFFFLRDFIFKKTKQEFLMNFLFLRKLNFKKTN